MENVKPSAASVAIKWALFNVLLSIVLIYVYHSMAVAELSKIRYLSFIPFIIFLLLAQKEFRDKLGGFMTYGQGFVAGLLFAVFAGILGAIFWYIFYRILTPSAYDQMLIETRSQLDLKKTPSDQADAVIDFYRKYGGIVFPFFAVLGSTFFGAIFSLIGAAIFKKERSVLDIEQANNYSDPS